MSQNCGWGKQAHTPSKMLFVYLLIYFSPTKSLVMSLFMEFHRNHKTVIKLR